MAESLFNKKCICIITGTSQGYGKCIAESFARTCASGSLLILLSRNTSKVKEVANDIHSNCPGITVVVQKLDLADSQQCSVENFQVILNTHNIILGDFERVMLVHNSASLGDVTKFVWQLTDKDVVENCITVNVTGTILFNAAILDAVKKADVKSTAVINISSLAALQAFPSWSLYCAGKAARDRFFETLAKEDPKMRVLNWAPGPMDTDMQEMCRKCADETVRQFFIDRKEKGTLLTCAESVAKLISVLDKNTFESGQHIDYYDV